MARLWADASTLPSAVTASARAKTVRFNMVVSPSPSLMAVMGNDGAHAVRGQAIGNGRGQRAVGEHDVGFADVPAAHGGAPAEFRMIEHQETLAAVLGQRLAHADLLVGEIEQRAVLVDTAHPV